MGEGERFWKHWLDLIELMKAIFLFLLVTWSAVGQTTFNNVAVKTNLTVASVPVGMVVKTVDDLLLVTPVLTNYGVRVQGRTNSGDGGGGIFQAVPVSGLTTNWGTVFASTSASYYWKRIQEGPNIDLRWFAPLIGKGYGSVNAVRIQSAIDYAKTIPGNQVFVPDLYYLAQGGTPGVGIRVPYGVSLFGSPSEIHSILASGATNSAIYKGGYQGGFAADDNSNVPLIDWDGTGGYVQQTNNVIWDGTVVASKYVVNSSMSGLVFVGNSANNSDNSVPLVKAFSVWDLTIKDCAITDAKGPSIWIRDCNGVIFRNNTVMGGRGILIDDCADFDVSNNWSYGAAGPNYKFLSSWKGTVLNNQTGNSVAGLSGTVSGVSGNVMTATSHGLYSGALVWIYSTTTMPSPLVSTRPYYAIRLTANTFSVATNYSTAIAGTPVTLSTSGSGTITFTDGPSVSYHLITPTGTGVAVTASGTIRNTFIGNRSDQTLQGGWYIDGASQNTLVGNYVVEAKFGGSGTVSAVYLTNSAVKNVLSGFVVDNSADVGITIGANCDQNQVGVNAIDATTRWSVSGTGTSGTFVAVPGVSSSTNISVGSITASTATVGSTSSGTVAAFTGGTAGAAIATFARSGQPTVGFRNSGGAYLYDETNLKGIARIRWSGSSPELLLGTPGTATPADALIQGEQASGTDVAGKALYVRSGQGTGAGSTTGATVIIQTAATGASSSSGQSYTTRAYFDETVSSTLLPMWINYNGTLKQVQVGASDSGGTGFRLLRITTMNTINCHGF